MHEDELEMDADLARRLIETSLPGLGEAPIVPLHASGSPNMAFRVGEDLVVRFPRQPGGSTSIDAEAHWLPWLANRLTTHVPEVVAVGEPGFGYPERWLVTRWLDGDPPGRPGHHDEHPTEALALGVASFVSELGRVVVPPEANKMTWYRGGPLAALADDFSELLEQADRIPGLDLDLSTAERVWRNALDAERSLRPATTWVHGDLLAENLLVDDRRLAAVLDFGTLSVGDPTVDLIVAWEALDAEGRRTFRAALDVDDATWSKSMGWALVIALMTFPYYWETMPSRCADRRAMAETVLAED